MSRRYYAKGKKTYAKDQSFEQDQVGEEKERFLISIDLMSLKIKKLNLKFKLPTTRLGVLRFLQ